MLELGTLYLYKIEIWYDSYRHPISGVPCHTEGQSTICRHCIEKERKRETENDKEKYCFQDLRDISNENKTYWTLHTSKHTANVNLYSKAATYTYTDSAALNSHHWWSQCCGVGWSTTRFISWKCHRTKVFNFSSKSTNKRLTCSSLWKLTEIYFLNGQAKVFLIGLFRVKYEMDCYSQLNILYWKALLWNNLAQLNREFENELYYTRGFSVKSNWGIAAMYQMSTINLSTILRNLTVELHYGTISSFPPERWRPFLLNKRPELTQTTSCLETNAIGPWMLYTTE